MESGERIFIVNPKSGKGKGLEYEKWIKEWFRTYGVDPLVILTSKEGENSPFELGKKAAKRRVAAVGIVGGDGTANLFVNGMMASNVCPEEFPPIGLFPVGVGNNLARNNGIPHGFEEQMEIIIHGRTVLVDVGLLTTEKEKKYFLNVVSFGFDAEVTEKAKIQKEKYFFVPKTLSYGLTALQEILRGLPSYQIKVQGRGFTFDSRMSLVAALIGPTYGAIFRIAPEADSTDGLFDVCMIDKIESTLSGKKRAATILIQATQGKHLGQPEVCLYRTPFLEVSSSQSLPCEMDGEILSTGKNYSISILPKALKILVPEAYAPEYQSA